MKIREKIGKELLFFDGAMGTMLQERGLKTGEIPETWNILHPEEIKRIGREYLEAGSNIILSNTFGANRFKCESLPYTTEQLVKEGVLLAKQAVKEFMEAHPDKTDAYAALDIGSLGKLLKPLGNLSFDDAYDAFAEIIKYGTEAGADLILLETFSDMYEVKAAALAAKENSDLPVIVTMAFDEQGKLLTGGDIRAAVAMLEGIGVDVIGFNCGLGPEQMLKLLPVLTEATSTPIAINPNAGLPVVVNGKTVFQVEPEAFAESAKQLVLGGASLIGGCCGTTPKHIKALVEACSELEVVPVEKKHHTVVSSYTHAVRFGKKPYIIGERINPTGKSKFKQALRDHNMEYIFREGLTQEERGAHILDVNVGLPEIDEVSMMIEAVTGLQAITGLPLQIDTTNLEAMEKAMRYYNGKPMINSVNGKQESMHSVFPLVKKYGGVVVCLTLDEDGIPETADGRIAIAKKIIETAASYGIDKKDLVMDTLVMTISTGTDNANITLEALRRARYELGVHTVLGVSNISFGLPQRGTINTAFYTMAMQNGLSAGIVNPSSDMMMGAYYSFCALIGEDDQCMQYIEKCSAQPETVNNTAGQQMSLHDAIVKGLSESASETTKELLRTGKDSLAIINEDLIPALDVVGKGFEEKKMFLPQLLMSAEAAKASFEAIKDFLSGSGQTSETKAKVILATVKGDIHDIGKNIVKVLLENYGFDVIDLGKDVAPELIVQTAKEQNVALIGLSALMTTTVVNMEETIKQLRSAEVPCRVMVGGAVLTQEYADMIGADFYSKDAMGSVRYANNLYEEGLLNSNI